MRDGRAQQRRTATATAIRDIMDAYSIWPVFLCLIAILAIRRRW